MRLDRVLMACDLNPDYLEYWPSARRAWLEIVGVEPLLVLIAEIDDVPCELAEDPLVVPFTPLPGVHTALQAQCVRLLYPAIVDTRDAVLVSDIDLYPLRPSYFLDPIKRLDPSFFVSFRDIYLEREMVCMLNAATPQTWSELFGVSTLEHVRARLSDWTSGIEYHGGRAWPGWYTDQQILYRALTSWPDASRRWWMLDDDYCRHNQLDRLELMNEQGLRPHRQTAILAQKYTEYVCLFPYRQHREVNDLVLTLACRAARMERRP